MLSHLKSAIFGFYLYSGYVPLRDWILARLGRSRAVIVYYHRVGACDVLSKPTLEFRRDLAYLKRNYECIGLRELCARLSSGKPLKRRVAVVTFDDGYHDNYTHAVPALRDADMTATFYVSTGFIGTERAFLHDGPGAKDYGGVPGDYPKMTWDDLRDMEAKGFEIGAHTVEHLNLGRAEISIIERELHDALTSLDRELGQSKRAFSFPWGKPNDISESAVKIARQAGYYSVASAYGGANLRGRDVFHLRRVDVGNGHLSDLAVRARIAGFDPDFWRLKLKNRHL